MSAGMLLMFSRDAVCGLWSTFSFANFTRPAISAASSSITGAIILHGPHHGAHASTSTGIGERTTSLANVASLTSTGDVPACSGFLHLPQTGASPAWSLSAAIRLFAPHERQRMMVAGDVVFIRTSMLVFYVP